MALGTIAAIGSVLISAGSAIADHKSQEDRAEAVRAAAKKARKAEVRDITIRKIEETRAARQQQRRIGEQSDRVQGAARASAAASGVEGMTLDLLLGDIEGSEGRARAVAGTNLDTVLSQLDRMIEGAFAREESRAAGAPEPSLLGTGLRIGGGVLSAITLREQLKGPSIGDRPADQTDPFDPEEIGTTTGGGRG